MDRRLEAAQAASAAALAAALSLVKVPFPPVPYLVFDLGEVPIIALFLAGARRAALVSSLAYFIVLNIIGSNAPIGPLMRLIALLSTLAPLYFFRGPPSGPRLIAAFAAAAASTTAVMTVANYALLAWLMPAFLAEAANATSVLLGGVRISELELTLLLSAAFNVIQVAISLWPAALAARLASRAGLV